MIDALPRTDFSIHDLNTGQQCSGGELAAQVARRAGVLARRVSPDKRNFVIAHGNSADFFADLFAVWQVGGCAVCVNPGLTVPELVNIVGFCEPAAVLVAEDITGDLDAPVLCTWREPKVPAPTRGLAQYPDDDALILFTSGTTGDPKGVVHSHRSLLARISLNIAHLGTGTLARTLCVLPTHFGHGLIGNCLTPLFAGAELHLMANPGVKGAAALGGMIDEHRISFMSSVPSFWKLALRLSAEPAGSSLKRINIGSAPLSGELWQAVCDWAQDAEVANMYGITETANWIGGASSRGGDISEGLLGRLWGGAAAIRDAEGQVVAIGEGEILLRVPSLMTRYYQRPDLSRAAMQDGWYRTGDTGRLDAEGRLHMTGRRAGLIIVAGVNIYPEELDLLFERHADVTEACAFGQDDDMAGQTVALAVSLRDGADTTVADLQHWVRARLRPEAVPRDIYVLADIPKTDRGKLNRALVRAACQQQGET